MKNLKLYDNIDEQKDDLLTPKPKYFLSYVYDIKESGCNDIDTNLEEMIPNNYIDTTNKRGAYFNTTYHPTDNTRIVCKFTVSSTNYGMIFSSSDSTYGMNVVSDSNNKLQFGCLNFTKSIDIEYDKEYIIDMSKDKVSLNGVLYKENIQCNQWQSLYALRIFCGMRSVHGGIYGMHKGKIFYLKVYENDKLKLQFIPHMKDNVYGMLETISGDFYPSIVETQFDGYIE